MPKITRNAVATVLEAAGIDHDDARIIVSDGIEIRPLTPRTLRDHRAIAAALDGAGYVITHESTNRVTATAAAPR